MFRPDSGYPFSRRSLQLHLGAVRPTEVDDPHQQGEQDGHDEHELEEPQTLPHEIVERTAERYRALLERLTLGL